MSADKPSDENSSPEKPCENCQKATETANLNTLTCHHSFCIDCLETLMASADDSEKPPGCPVCKSPVDAADLYEKIINNQVMDYTLNEYDDGAPEQFHDSGTGEQIDRDEEDEEEDSFSELDEEPVEGGPMLRGRADTSDEPIRCRGPCALLLPPARMHQFPGCKHMVCFLCLRFEANVARYSGERTQCPKTDCKRRLQAEDLKVLKDNDSWFSEVFDQLNKPIKPQPGPVDKQKMLDTVKAQFKHQQAKQQQKDKPAANANSCSTIKVSIVHNGKTVHTLNCAHNYKVEALVNRIGTLLKMKACDWEKAVVQLKRNSTKGDDSLTVLKFDKDQQRKTVSQIGLEDGDNILIQLKPPTPASPDLESGKKQDSKSR